VKVLIRRSPLEKRVPSRSSKPRLRRHGSRARRVGQLLLSLEELHLGSVDLGVRLDDGLAMLPARAAHARLHLRWKNGGSTLKRAIFCDQRGRRDDCRKG